MSADDVELSSTVTVGQYREMAERDNRTAAADFIRQRFQERYFRPIECSTCKHGFAVLAISCLVIEALESFYQGKADTKSKSKQMFRDFFARNERLKEFGVGGDWFFADIRSAILHQSETRGGWRIRREGLILDRKRKIINATALLNELRRALDEYADKIRSDDDRWSAFKRKMTAVCANCVDEESNR